jgi:hypothetical protein
MSGESRDTFEKLDHLLGTSLHLGLPGNGASPHVLAQWLKICDKLKVIFLDAIQTQSFVN